MNTFPLELKFRVFYYLTRRSCIKFILLDNLYSLSKNELKLLKRTDAIDKLHHAIKFGYTNLLQLLFDKGYKGDLYWASKCGNEFCVKKILLQKNNTLNKKDKINNTALVYAVQNGHTKIVKLLIEAGADLSIRYSLEQTILDHAANTGSSKITQLLIENGADVNTQNIWGWTPLHVAYFQRRKNIVRILLANNADPNIRTYDWKKKPSDLVVNLTI